MKLNDFFNTTKYSITIEHNEQQCDRHDSEQLDEQSEKYKRLGKQIDMMQAQITAEMTDRPVQLDFISQIEKLFKTNPETAMQLLDRESRKAERVLKKHETISASAKRAQALVDSYMASSTSRKRVQQLAKTQIDL
jgi:protein gp37